MQHSPIITMRDVSVRYKRASAPALYVDTLDIEPGEFLFLIGASGSGKSTLLKTLTKEVLPTTGTVRVLKRNIYDLNKYESATLRRDVGVIFQNFRLIHAKTIAQNIAFAAEVVGTSDREIAAKLPEVLALVGLEHKADAYPNELSGGEQQRAAIARSFINQPPILLADEPTGNVDPLASKQIIEILRLIAQSGTTVAVATHDETLVNKEASRVLGLRGGEIVRDSVGAYDVPIPSSAR